MTQKYKNIKFKTNLPYVVRLKYDQPKDGKGEYGDYWIYGVEYEGEDYTFIANLNLHTMLSLSHYKKGDLLEIMKVEGNDNKTFFEVEQLSEDDIKSTEQPPGKTEAGPDWNKINADKQHSIVLQVAMKLAVQSFPVKAKLIDKDYEEIEIRTVKFNAIMGKYLGVVMKEPEHKFSPLVQAKWDEFDKFLESHKDVENYKKVRSWLDNLTDPTTKVLTKQLAKLKESLVLGEYESYHESLITACCETLKTKDRLPVIQTLNNIVKSWNIEGLEKLSDTTENQCLNLLEEFDKQLKEEIDSSLPY